ncbi:MAG TPA: acyltransferase [Candidatus Nanoarchaeia archaeon]|nr:acyltransferase [Candidatus Nanoarchaeia archaeon]
MPQPTLIPHDKGMVSTTATIGDHVTLGTNSRVWHQCIVYGTEKRPVHIGKDTQIGSQSHIKPGVTIGDYCRLQDGISIPDLVTLGNYVFVGPRVTFTNDLFPTVAKILAHSYKELETIIGDHVTLGASSTIICGITIGAFAQIGMSAAVTKNVPPFAVVAGVPARILGDVRDEKYRIKYPELIPLYERTYKSLSDKTPINTKQ